MLSELVIASHNQGKIAEFKNMLSPLGVTVYSAAELNLPDVEETGTTFFENAQIKAEALSSLTGKPCLADDSGLCVHTLNNAPGVYSARYAPNRNFDLAMTKLIDEKLEGMDDVVLELVRCKTENENLKNKVNELNKENFKLKNILNSFKPLICGFYVKKEEDNNILL